MSVIASQWLLSGSTWGFLPSDVSSTWMNYPFTRTFHVATVPLEEKLDVTLVVEVLAVPWEAKDNKRVRALSGSGT